jgi:hypothetical protein
LLVVAVLALEPASAFAQESVKIGFFAPLTGFAAADGASAKHSAEIAVEELNAAGGIKGKKVELVTYEGEVTKLAQIQVIKNGKVRSLATIDNPDVLGGLGSVPGTVLGGLIVGVVETLAIGLVDFPLPRDAWAFLAMIAVFLARPQGLLGVK